MAESRESVIEIQDCESDLFQGIWDSFGSDPIISCRTFEILVHERGQTEWWFGNEVANLGR